MLRLWHDEESVSNIVKLAKNKRFPNINKLYIKELNRKITEFRNIINFNIPYSMNKLWIGYAQFDDLLGQDYMQLL